MSAPRIGPRVAVIGAGLLAVAVLAAAAVVWRATRGDATGPGTPGTSAAAPSEEAADTGPEFPVDGTYQLKAGHSGQCLGVGPERGNEQRAVLVQQPCDGAWPDIEVTETEQDGVFRFVLKYADTGWEDCVAVDKPGTKPGALLAGNDCADTDRLQTFRLERLPEAGRYLIHPGAGDLCLGIREESAVRGTVVETTRCDAALGSQQFRFVPKTSK